MSHTLGEKLRQAREERGISISEVAEQTRISSLYLKSIEDDNYKPLPGGIFNKGFVKAYAKYVGIDEQEALQDYARLIAKHEEVSETEQPRYRPEVLTDDARTASSMVPTIVFAGIILALMTGGILFVVNYIQNQPDSPPVANDSSGNSSIANSNAGVSDETTGDVTTATPDQIRVEFRALAEKVSVTSTVDGTLGYDEVTPDAPKTYTAQQGVKLRYYRGFAEKVQIVVNGKVLAAPPAPLKGNIEFEINKENVGRILTSGTLVEAGDPARPQPAPAATVAGTSSSTNSNTGPRPNSTPPTPAFTPQSSPRRSPTPIIVGRSPTPRPSPN